MLVLQQAGNVLAQDGRCFLIGGQLFDRCIESKVGEVDPVWIRNDLGTTGQSP